MLISQDVNARFIIMFNCFETLGFDIMLDKYNDRMAARGRDLQAVRRRHDAGCFRGFPGALYLLENPLHLGPDGVWWLRV